MNKQPRNKASRLSRRAAEEQVSRADTKVGSAKKNLRGGRTWILVLLLFCVLVTVWYFGLAATTPQQLARTHASRNRLQEAAYWLNWAEWLSYRNSENSLLAARIARYRGDSEGLQSMLSEARLRGADIKRVELERMLAMAQIGELTEIETELGLWLQQPNSELDEISNAYANGLAASGRFEEAYQVLYAWREDFPNDPRCDYRIGRLKEHQENYEDAQKSYLQAISLDPNYFPARFSLGRVLLHQRQAQEALEQLQYCYKMDRPEAAMVEAAITLKALGRSDDARPIFKRVLDQPRDVIDAAYAAVEEQPEGFRPAAEYGRLESDAGNFEAALPWLEAALEENPLDLSVRYSLGVTLRGLGRIEEAEREFIKVQTARENMGPANAFNERIKRDPLDHEARLGLGRLVLENESERTGLYWIRSVLSFDPNHREAHQTLADFYQSKVRKDPRYKALVEYHRSKVADADSKTNQSKIGTP